MLDPIHARSHGLRTRLFAAVLLLPLIAVATATSGAWLRCRITGEVSRACCCADDDAAAKAAPVATTSEADCCDRVVRDVTTAPAVLSTTAALPDQTTPVAYLAVRVAAIDPLPAIVSARSEIRSGTRPSTVRLRLITKSSFLI